MRCVTCGNGVTTKYDTCPGCRSLGHLECAAANWTRLPFYPTAVCGTCAGDFLRCINCYRWTARTDSFNVERLIRSQALMPDQQMCHSCAADVLVNSFVAGQARSFSRDFPPSSTPSPYRVAFTP